MKIIETNCETGETIERDMTAEEEIEHAIRLAGIQSLEEQESSSRIARESALAKLQSLGLTAEEAALIVS